LIVVLAAVCALLARLDALQANPMETRETPARTITAIVSQRGAPP
jgi:hypothetical protein